MKMNKTIMAVFFIVTLITGLSTARVQAQSYAESYCTNTCSTIQTNSSGGNCQTQYEAYQYIKALKNGYNSSYNACNAWTAQLSECVEIVKYTYNYYAPTHIYNNNMSQLDFCMGVITAPNSHINIDWPKPAPPQVDLPNTMPYSQEAYDAINDPYTINESIYKEFFNSNANEHPTCDNSLEKYLEYFEWYYHNAYYSCAHPTYNPYCYTTCCNELTQNSGNSGSSGNSQNSGNSLIQETKRVTELLSCGNDKTSCSVGQPVNLATGNMYLQHVDYEVGGLSSELTLIRTYNSQSDYNGIFGMGWSTGFMYSVNPQNTNADLISIGFEDGHTVYYERTGSTNNFAPSMPSGDKSSLVYNISVDNYTLTFETGEKHVFDPNGQILSKTDRNGNATIFSNSVVNGQFKMSITSPAGKTLNFSYHINGDESGKVASISDNMGYIASYTYEKISGTVLLKSVTYADGSKYQYSYGEVYSGNNSSGLHNVLTQVSDAAGNVIEKHEYDPNTGKATTSEINNGVEKYTISYPSPTKTQVVDALNRVMTVTFKDINNKKVVNSITGPYKQQPQTTRYKKYDKELKLTREIDQLGNETQYKRSGNTDTISMDIAPYTGAEKTALFIYNDFRQIVTAQDALGYIHNTYDLYGNLVTSKTGEGNNTSAPGRMTTYQHGFSRGK